MNKTFSMENIELIKDQIRLEYPKQIISSISDTNEVIYINFEPFGKLSMDSELNILIRYNNPYIIDFIYFKQYFEPRLKFDNASTYIYEDNIKIFVRIGNDRQRSNFENSMSRASNFIQTAMVIEEFIKLNNH